MSTLDTRNFTKSKPPSFPYQKALEKALPGWDISLVFAGEQRAQSLNIALRNKDYVPNVLSYETGTRSGEVIICPAVAKRQAASYDLSYRDMLGFLFIHGLLHLKGMAHGATMERRERDVLSQFIRLRIPSGSTHRNRHRHRNTPHESRGGRRG